MNIIRLNDNLIEVVVPVLPKGQVRTFLRVDPLLVERENKIGCCCAVRTAKQPVKDLVVLEGTLEERSGKWTVLHEVQHAADFFFKRDFQSEALELRARMNERINGAKLPMDVVEFSILLKPHSCIEKKPLSLRIKQVRKLWNRKENSVPNEVTIIPTYLQKEIQAIYPGLESTKL